MFRQKLFASLMYFRKCNFAYLYQTDNVLLAKHSFIYEKHNSDYQQWELVWTKPLL